MGLISFSMSCVVHALTLWLTDVLVAQRKTDAVILEALVLSGASSLLFKQFSEQKAAD